MKKIIFIIAAFLIYSQAKTQCIVGSAGVTNLVYNRACSTLVSTNLVVGANISVGGNISGTWQGNIVAQAYGGTGYNSFSTALGAAGMAPGSVMLYTDTASISNRINTKLSKSDTTNKWMWLGMAWTKSQSDTRYLQSFTESDPIYKSDSNLYVRKTYLNTALLNYYTKDVADGKYSLLSNSYIKTQVDSIKTTITKTSIGLGSVDNTSDASKPISTPTQTALNAKQDIITTGVSTQYFKGDLTLATFPSIPAALTAGSNISITSNQINNTAPDQVVTLMGANNLVISGTYPNFTITQYIPSVNSGVTRAINSSTYTISTTKQATVSYTIKISCTASIGSSADGKLALQYSTNGGSTWIDVGEVENSSTVTLAITLNSVTVQTANITGVIPANALVKMVPTVTGGATITYIRGQETY